MKFNDSKFIMAMFLIITAILFLVFELADDHIRTMNFIKWVFITYCSSDVGEKVIEKLGNKQ